MAEALGIAHYTTPDGKEAQRGPFAWAHGCWGSYSAGIVAFEPYTLELHEKRGNTGKRPYKPLSPHGVQSPARDLGDWYAEAQRLHASGQQLNLGAIPGDYFCNPDDGEIRASLCCDFDSCDEFVRAYAMWPLEIDQCPVVRTVKGFHVWFSYSHGAGNKGITGRDGQQGSLTLDLFGSGGSCVRLPGCYSAAHGQAGGPPVRTVLVRNNWQPCTAFGHLPSELAQLAHDGCTAERLRLEIERLYAAAGLLDGAAYAASVSKYERRHGTRTDRASAATCGAAAVAAPLTPGQQPQCADAEKSRAIAYYEAAVRNACGRLATCSNGHETMLKECNALAKLRNGHEGELADFADDLLAACLESWTFHTKTREATAADLRCVIAQSVQYVQQHEKPLSWAEIAPDRPVVRGSAQRTWIPRRSVADLLTAMLKEGASDE